MPSRGVLLALFLLALTPPFIARASGTIFGAFTMFTRIERYHLELGVRSDAGEESIKLRSLAPHLSRDAKRALIPADGYAFGADQVDVVAGGLKDIARLLCDVRPRAVSTRVTFYRGSLERSDMASTEIELPCGARPVPEASLP